MTPWQVATVLLTVLRPDPDQPRKEFPEESLKELAESLKTHGQWVPLIIRKDGTIVDGERRYRAALLVGIDRLNCIVVADGLSPPQMLNIQLATLQRSDLPPFDLFSAYMEWFKRNPEKQAQDLKASVNRSQSWISKVISLKDCPPPVYEAAKKGLIGVNAWYDINRQPDEASKLALLEEKLKGAATPEKKTRKARNQYAEEPKLDKATILLAGGGSIAVKAKGLGMAELVEMLEGVLKKAKKAVGQYEIKTWLAMLKDELGGHPNASEA